MAGNILFACATQRLTVKVVTSRSRLVCWNKDRARVKKLGIVHRRTASCSTQKENNVKGVLGETQIVPRFPLYVI